MIQIKKLSKSFGNHQVLKGIDLNLADNCIHGIIGMNGAGKTTLFNCINKLEPYEGEIVISEISTLGYLPTQLFFYSKMKGIEYVEFCLVAQKIKPDKKKIAQFNEIFELPLQSYASEYSTGMKKKLALMALFLQNNDCYILDEPFNGLDLSACILLKQLLQKKQILTLISSHIISSLTDLCCDISLLSEGRIMQTYLPNQFATIENDLIESSLVDKIKCIQNGIF